MLEKIPLAKKTVGEIEAMAGGPVNIIIWDVN